MKRIKNYGKGISLTDGKYYSKGYCVVEGDYHFDENGEYIWGRHNWKEIIASDIKSRKVAEKKAETAVRIIEKVPEINVDNLFKVLVNGFDELKEFKNIRDKNLKYFLIKKVIGGVLC